MFEHIFTSKYENVSKLWLVVNVKDLSLSWVNEFYFV